MCTLYTCQMRVSKFRASFSSWHATSCPRDWYRHLSDICQRLPDDMSKVVSESVAITISRFTSELVKQCVRVYSSPEIRRSKCGNKCQNECCMKLPDKCLNIYNYIYIWEHNIYIYISPSNCYCSLFFVRVIVGIHVWINVRTCVETYLYTDMFYVGVSSFC
jgi:hypothetical protein